MVLSFAVFSQRYHERTTKDCANLRSNKDLRGNLAQAFFVGSNFFNLSLPQLKFLEEKTGEKS